MQAAWDECFQSKRVLSGLSGHGNIADIRLKWQRWAMRVIRLDASMWRSAADFYSALLPRLGAPNWHGRNLDAVYDSLSGGIYEIEPPFTVVVERSAEVSQAVADLLAEVVTVFEDARTEFGVDVSIGLE